MSCSSMDLDGSESILIMFRHPKHSPMLILGAYDSRGELVIRGNTILLLR